MFDREQYTQSYGSTAIQDGVTISRSACCVNVYFDVAGFTREQISVSVDNPSGTVTVNADNGSSKKSYSVIVGEVETPEKRVAFADAKTLSVTFAKKAKRTLTVQ